MKTHSEHIENNYNMQEISVDDFLDKGEHKQVHTIELDDNIYVDVMINLTTGLAYAMQQENGSIGYDYDGRSYSSLDEARIVSFVKKHI